MQLDTDLSGLLGVSLAVLMLLARVPRVKALPPHKRAGLLAAAIIVISIPLWGVSLAGFVRGITGDLSATTLVLLMLVLARSFFDHVLVEDSNRRLTLQTIAIAAVVFYPFALGFTMFDPYRLGYGNLWFMTALLGLAVWSCLRYSTLTALCIALAVAAWSAGWYESPNLWDYMLDPWVAVYACAVQVKRQWIARKGEIYARFKP